MKTVKRGIIHTGSTPDKRSARGMAHHQPSAHVLGLLRRGAPLLSDKIRPLGYPSAPSHKYLGIRTPLHPLQLRCASSPYSPGTPSLARLAGAAHRRSRCIKLFVRRYTGLWNGGRATRRGKADTLENAVILMAKSPIAGRVKTRLCPPLRLPESAALYACMLADTASEVSALTGVRRYLFLDPPESAEYFRRPPFAAFEPSPQRGGDLGDRMHDAAATAFRRGANRVAIVGADCPSLSAGRIRRAFRELSTGASVVFGPSADGGFYLVGLSSRCESPFGGYRWSTPEVLRNAAARCRILSVTFSFLPPERDVDTWEDLLALREWTRTHSRPACPRTREWITAFFGPGGGGSPGSTGRRPGLPRDSRSRREG